MQAHQTTHHGQPSYCLNSADENPNPNMLHQNLFALTPDLHIFNPHQMPHSALSPQMPLLNPSTSSPSFCPSYLLLRPDSPLQYPDHDYDRDVDNDIDINPYVDNVVPHNEQHQQLIDDPLTLSASYPYPLYTQMHLSSNHPITASLNDTYDHSESVTLSPAIPSNTNSSLSPSDVSSNANATNYNNSIDIASLLPPPPIFMGAHAPLPGVLFIPSLLPPPVNEPAHAPNNATVLSVYNITETTDTTDSTSSSSNNIATSSYLNEKLLAPPSMIHTQCNINNETPPMLASIPNLTSIAIPQMPIIPNAIPHAIPHAIPPAIPAIPSIPPIASISVTSPTKQASDRDLEDEKDEIPRVKEMNFEANQAKEMKKEMMKTEAESKPMKSPKSKSAKVAIKRTRKRKTNKKQKIVKDEKDEKDEKEKKEDLTDQERRRIKNPKTRRKHTAIACIRCWKAKTRCSVRRPCDRCIRIGYDDCVDRPSSSRRRQNVSKKKLTKSKKSSRTKPKPKREQKQHLDCDIHDHEQCEPHAHSQTNVTPKTNRHNNKNNNNNNESANISNKLPQLKPQKLWSVTTSSLSEIMSGFNKEKEKEQQNSNPPMTRRDLWSSTSLPMNYQYTHTMPPNMIKCFEKPILNNLAPDICFKYLPVISRYQLSTKSYCDSCFGLLLNQDKDVMHLKTPHNYACSNRDCHREFVEKSHLEIHLKICGELSKLSQNVKGIANDQQFEEIIQLVLKPPIQNYFEIVRDVLPTNQWLTQQIEWKQKHQRKRCKNNPNEHKRKLCQSEKDSPKTKRRKLNSSNPNKKQ